MRTILNAAKEINFCSGGGVRVKQGGGGVVRVKQGGGGVVKVRR